MQLEGANFSRHCNAHCQLQLLAGLTRKPLLTGNQARLLFCRQPCPISSAVSYYLWVRKKFWLSGRVNSNLRPSNTSGFRATAAATTLPVSHMHWPTASINKTVCR